MSKQTDKQLQFEFNTSTNTPKETLMSRQRDPNITIDDLIDDPSTPFIRVAPSSKSQGTSTLPSKSSQQQMDTNTAILPNTSPDTQEPVQLVQPDIHPLGLTQSEIETRFTNIHKNNLIREFFQEYFEECPPQTPLEETIMIMLAEAQHRHLLAAFACSICHYYTSTEEDPLENKLDCIQQALDHLYDMHERDLIHIYKWGATPRIQAIYELTDHEFDQLPITYYTPPMVEPPKHLRTNYDKPYYLKETHAQPTILGYYENMHNKPISLDILNLQNSMPLTLNEAVASTPIECKLEQILESLAHEYEDEDLSANKRQVLEAYQYNKKQFLKEYYEVLNYLEGTSFYLTHSYDSRGRMYQNGYHINGQGHSYQRALIDFEEPCLINQEEEDQEYLIPFNTAQLEEHLNTYIPIDIEDHLESERDIDETINALRQLADTPFNDNTTPF